MTVSGTSTSPADGWAAGPPYWRAGDYWRNRGGGVTFPLQRGGWSRKSLPVGATVTIAGFGGRAIPQRAVANKIVIDGKDMFVAPLGQ